jgi:hypothetical protein
MFLRRGQSLLEYVTLFCMIVAALLIMQAYIKRGYQGRIKQEADSLGQQYSPKHSTSATQVTTDTTSESFSGAGIYHSNIRGSDVTVPEGMSASVSTTKTNLTRDEKIDSFSTE